MTLAFKGCSPLLAEDPSGFNVILIVHFCSDVGRDEISSIHVLYLESFTIQ